MAKLKMTQKEFDANYEIEFEEKPEVTPEFDSIPEEEVFTEQELAQDKELEENL